MRDDRGPTGTGLEIRHDEAQAILLGTGRLLSACWPASAGRRGERRAGDCRRRSAVDRKEVEKIVRDYLLNNPESCSRCSRRSRPSRRKSSASRSSAIIKDAKDEIFNSAYDGIVGNPNGKVTIVEFFDYNCGYCKRAIEDMQALTAADPDLRFVLKEFPILGPDSQKAHVVSMAFRTLMPEKYGEFHNQLLGGQGRAGEATAIKIAAVARRRRGEAARGDEEPGDQRGLQQDLRPRQQAGDHRHASYVVGNEVVFGALGPGSAGREDRGGEAPAPTAAC